MIFQLPAAMSSLSEVHPINPRLLGSIRRYVVVAAPPDNQHLLRQRTARPAG